MKTDNATFLGEQPLLSLLVKMSTPAIIGMMVVALYNVVDTIFVGRGAGSLAIAGLAIAFPIQMIIGAIGQMVGVGAASIVSRRLGEKDMVGAETALGTSLVFTAGIGIVLTLLLATLTDPILLLFGATQTILPYAHDYVVFQLFAMPFHAIGMAGNNLIRAEGNAKTAMNTMLIGVILNIILDPIFIFGFEMGIKGAAIATVIGQMSAFIWVTLYYLPGNSVVSIRRKNLKIQTDLLQEVLILGLPNFIQMAGISIIATILNNILGVYVGDIGISAYGIISRLFSFVIMPISGLAQGFQPIAGYNWGAKQYDRVRSILYLTLFVSTVVGLVIFGIIILFPENLVGLFTTDKALIDYTVPALRLIALFTPVIGIQVISSIHFQAIGKGIPALLLGLSRQFIILLPVVLLFPRLFGAEGIWYSFPVSDALSTIITVGALYFELKNLKMLHNTNHVIELNSGTEAALS